VHSGILARAVVALVAWVALGLVSTAQASMLVVPPAYAVPDATGRYYLVVSSDANHDRSARLYARGANRLSMTPWVPVHNSAGRYRSPLAAQIALETAGMTTVAQELSALHAGDMLIAYNSCLRGLAKLEADPARLAADLESNWEVLAEAVQQVMRRHGVADAYDKLKAISRGKRLDRSQLAAFVKALPIPPEAKKRLLALTPAKYNGLATELAKRV
jgi:hypothetical protein